MCPGLPRHLGPPRGIGEENGPAASRRRSPVTSPSSARAAPASCRWRALCACSFPAEVASGMITAGLPRAVSSTKVPAPLRDTTTFASARTSGSSGPTNLDPRTFRQPGGDRARFTIRQQVNRPAGLDVDQNGPVDMALAHRVLVDAEHPRVLWLGNRESLDQPQDRVPADLRPETSASRAPARLARGRPTSASADRIRSVCWMYRRVRPASCSTNVRRMQETFSHVNRRTRSRRPPATPPREDRRGIAGRRRATHRFLLSPGALGRGPWQFPAFRGPAAARRRAAISGRAGRRWTGACHEARAPGRRRRRPRRPPRTP